MNCENCHAALPEQARFCDQCGKPVPSRPSEVRSEQKVERLKGQAVGIIDKRGGERPGNLSSHQEFGTIEEGGSAVGAILGGGGDVHVGGRQNYDRREVNTGGGAYVEGGVNTNGGDFAGNTINKVGPVSTSTPAVGGGRATASQVSGGQDLAALFDSVRRRIESRPEHADVDKEEVWQTVGWIEAEACKGEEANTAKAQRWLKTLAALAPDIMGATATSLLNPAAGVAPALRAVAERALRKAAPESD